MAKYCRPVCLVEGECFARYPSGKCSILNDAPREKCSFQKTLDEYYRGLAKYGGEKSE